MIIKSDTYTSLLGEPDAKNIVEKSFFLQKFCKKKKKCVAAMFHQIECFYGPHSSWNTLQKHTERKINGSI